MYQKALFVLTHLFFSFVVGNVTEKGGGSSEFSAVFAYAETACFDSCDVSVCPPATDAQAVSTDKCLFAGAEYSGAEISKYPVRTLACPTPQLSVPAERRKRVAAEYPVFYPERLSGLYPYIGLYAGLMPVFIGMTVPVRCGIAMPIHPSY